MTNLKRSLPRRSFLAAAGSLVGSTMLGGTHMVVGAPQSPDGELTRLSATRLAQMIREKKVSSSEVVGAYLDRIGEIEEKINAVTYLARDEAIAQARLADEAITQGKVDWATQPLFGVPVSFKDNLETSGMRTTAGSPALSRNVPSKDATVVQRMKAAGAIVLAKTNLPLFAWRSTQVTWYMARPTIPMT